jgi:CheY-like chemotaxis protein
MIRARVVQVKASGPAVSPVTSADFRAFVSMWFPDRTTPFTELVSQRPSSLADDRDPRGQQPVHVLLIEDDGAISEMYRVQLEYDGYRVSIATTGKGGFDAMGAARPDIVLLDLLLPDRSGLEIMADIKERFPNHPPVVILSNYGEPTMIERGISLGAMEYLVKSRVTPASVSEAIPGWIDQARRGQSGPRN